MINNFFHYLLDFSFAQSSTLALVLASILFGLLSPLLVVKQRVALADTLSHSFLPALVLAVVIRDVHAYAFWPILLIGALLITLISLFSIDFFQKHLNLPSESSIVLVMTFFFSFGVLLMSRLQGLGEIETLLFGDPLSASFLDCFFLSVLLLVVVFRLFLNRRSWENWLLDEDYSFIQGYPTKRLKLEFTILLSLAMISSLLIFGSLLILALLVIPATVVKPKSLVDSRIVFVNLIFTMLGLFLSYSFDLPTSATIGFLGTSWLVFDLFLTPFKLRR
jgi:iron/zinc/copper transport system substrate-binding protein/iron/zinc/copper transport system permease protein